MCITRIEDMTVDTFVCNDSNREAWERCKALLLTPEQYRLVFFALPADEGLHLKYAILNFPQQNVKWECATIGKFTMDLVDAIHAGNWKPALEKYTQPQALILDDLQHIAGKESTQEFFYRILKERLEQKKLTVLFSVRSLGTMRPAMTDELYQLLLLGGEEA